MVNQDEELVDTNLLNWTVTSVQQELIQIKLEFKQPLEVSQGDEPDYLVIQAQLSAFDDEFGQRLPESRIKRKDLPRMFASQSQAETINQASSSTFYASSSISAVNFTLSIAIKASMHQLWSLLNAQ